VLLTTFAQYLSVYPVSASRELLERPSNYGAFGSLKKIKPFLAFLRKEGLSLFVEPFGTLCKMFKSCRAGNLLPDLK